MTPSRITRFFAFAGLAVFLSVAPAYATVYNVPGDYATIQAALNAVGTTIVSGDTIRIAPGTYTENCVLGNATTGIDVDNLTIEGADPNNKPVIQNVYPTSDLQAAAVALIIHPPARPNEMKNFKLKNIIFRGNGMACGDSSKSPANTYNKRFPNLIQVSSSVTAPNYRVGTFVDFSAEGCEFDGMQCGNLSTTGVYGGGAGFMGAQAVYTNGTAVTVTRRSLTANVATLTFASHPFVVGQWVDVASVNVAAFNGFRQITAVTPTTISYACTNADVADAASGGTVDYKYDNISGPFAGTILFKNCVFKNIWSGLVFDPNNMGEGDCRQPSFITEATFENCEMFNNAGAVGFRCRYMKDYGTGDKAGTVVNVLNNYIHDYVGPMQGGAGAFKIFWPAQANFIGNTIDGIPLLQGAQHDETTAMGGALVIRDRRIVNGRTFAYNEEGLPPTEVNMRNNVIRNCVQAVFFDLVPTGVEGASWSWNPFIPAGNIQGNIMENCNWTLLVKNYGKLEPGADQLQIFDNTFGSGANQGPELFIRTGFESNGETIVIENNYYGNGGLADLTIVNQDDPGNPPVTATTASDTPNLMDDDGDGILNVQEDTNYNGVYDAATDYSNFKVADTDGDGVPDGIEKDLEGQLDANGDPILPKVFNVFVDADGDGLPAVLDPNDNNVDTDGDGYRDGYEYAMGTDPNNAASKPKLGDINDNNRIDNVDAIIIFQASIQALDYASFAGKVMRMDLDCDGKVSYVDAVKCFDKYLGIIKLLPAQ